MSIPKPYAQAKASPNTVTVTLPFESFCETLIALRNRRHNISNDLAKCNIPMVASISLRQIARLDECIAIIETAVGER